MRQTIILLVLSAVGVLCGRPADAQQRFQTLGPNECLNCHDHQAERQWYEKQEIPEVQKRFPQKGASAGHINALKQLEAAKSNDFAKAIGLKDKYDVKGSCVQCHGTVFSGDANAGVSCESCHGPGSGYLKPHQTKGSYDQATGLGMTKLVGNLAGWAQQCTSCHVLTDQRLIAAGHPSGDDFDLGAKYGPVAIHFKKKYSAADVTAMGRQQTASIIAKRRGGAAAPVVAVLPPAPAATSATASAAPVPPPAAPPPSARASAAAAPAAASTTRRPAASTPPSAVPPPSAPVATAPAPAPPPTLPASMSAAVALVQGRLIATLTDMLQRGASVSIRSSMPAPVLAPYSGPDAALLDLQREAIGLALDALGTAPVQPAAPPR